MIFEAFCRTVQARGLLSAGDSVLAAVSGGADSVALLRLLARYAERFPLTLVVAHVNHGVRGAAADEDQRFVESLARRLGLRCLALPAASAVRPRPAARPGEEALRRVRHALLARAARSHGCHRIALGHTMDDQAETVLMRLLRGAGRRGLSGMAFAGPGRLIRPLLGIRRAEARAYLEGIGQTYRRDETNTDERFLRNRIRGRLLPLLAGYNPSIVPALARTAELLAEEDRYLDELAAGWLAARARPARAGSALGTDAGPAVAVPAGDLSSLPAARARRVARLMLRDAGGDPRGARLTAVGELLALAAESDGAAVRRLAGGMTAAREGLEIIVAGRASGPGAAGAAGFSLTLPIPGRLELPGLGAAIEARVEAAPAAGELASGRDLAWLDADLLGSSVTVRTRLPGDLFHPLGAPGRRKLKEFLIDRKVPRPRRDRIPLVVGPAGIAWVVGERIGHPYRLTGATRRVAVLRYTKGVDVRA
ncbi:MAG: tRNA lysidine(34) synthetase TilS [Planctomycetota bacterium]